MFRCSAMIVVKTCCAYCGYFGWLSENCIEMIPVIPSIYIYAPTAQDLFCHFDILGLTGSLYDSPGPTHYIQVWV